MCFATQANFASTHKKQTNKHCVTLIGNDKGTATRMMFGN